mmetsp:Transcript_7900/g.25936  ORF Transcript_7900/g.25936 Transcript_7900/m.25936 type:complete len:386 (+) Transcript_7900:3329-4486(+)
MTVYDVRLPWATPRECMWARASPICVSHGTASASARRSFKSAPWTNSTRRPRSPLASSMRRRWSATFGWWSRSTKTSTSRLIASTSAPPRSRASASRTLLFTRTTPSSSSTTFRVDPKTPLPSTSLDDRVTSKSWPSSVRARALASFDTAPRASHVDTHIFFFFFVSQPSRRAVASFIVPSNLRNSDDSPHRTSLAFARIDSTLRASDASADDFASNDSASATTCDDSIFLGFGLLWATAVGGNSFCSESFFGLPFFATQPDRSAPLALSFLLQPTNHRGCSWLRKFSTSQLAGARRGERTNERTDGDTFQGPDRGRIHPATRRERGSALDDGPSPWRRASNGRSWRRPSLPSNRRARRRRVKRNTMSPVLGLPLIPMQWRSLTS